MDIVYTTLPLWYMITPWGGMEIPEGAWRLKPLSLSLSRLHDVHVYLTAFLICQAHFGVYYQYVLKEYIFGLLCSLLIIFKYSTWCRVYIIRYPFKMNPFVTWQISSLLSFLVSRVCISIRLAWESLDIWYFYTKEQHGFSKGDIKCLHRAAYIQTRGLRYHS